MHFSAGGCGFKFFRKSFPGSAQFRQLNRLFYQISENNSNCVLFFTKLDVMVDGRFQDHKKASLGRRTNSVRRKCTVPGVFERKHFCRTIYNVSLQSWRIMTPLCDTQGKILLHNSAETVSNGCNVMGGGRKGLR